MAVSDVNGDGKPDLLVANLFSNTVSVLKGKTMGVTEVAQAVQQAGYRTSAANFRVIVNQSLIKHRRLFKKVARGKYTAA